MQMRQISESRSQKDYFSLLGTIQGVFDELCLRLSNENIAYQIIGDTDE